MQFTLVIKQFPMKKIHPKKNSFRITQIYQTNPTPSNSKIKISFFAGWVAKPLHLYNYTYTRSTHIYIFPTSASEMQNRGIKFTHRALPSVQCFFLSVGAVNSITVILRCVQCHTALTKREKKKKEKYLSLIFIYLTN